MTQIEELIKQYHPETVDETKLALREIVQSLVLVGLSRGGFFQHASFYGGTALRIFYGLNRFSEDLDFTLNDAEDSFSMEPYIKTIKEIANSYGLSMDVSLKQKAIDTPVESAFAKLNTYQTFITLNLSEDLVKTLHRDEVLKVKFEIDCHPAKGFTTESRWIDMPEFAPVIVLDEPSLFAGKIHAVLCRNYKKHVKGRDYFDFLFFAKRHISPNMDFIRSKLTENGKIDKNASFDINDLKKMLIEKFNSVDFEAVKSDVQRFITRGEDLSYMSKDLFIQMAERL